MKELNELIEKTENNPNGSKKASIKLKAIKVVNDALPSILKGIDKGDLDFVFNEIESISKKINEFKESEFFNKFESGGIPIKPNRDHFKKSNK